MGIKTAKALLNAWLAEPPAYKRFVYLLPKRAFTNCRRSPMSFPMDYHLLNEPQHDVTRHGPSASQLFAALPLSRFAKKDLWRRMTEPTRRYHGISHLELLWRRHLRYAAEAALREQDHGLIALAIAYHDSIYVSGASDNESCSAAYWLEISAGQSICSEADRLWIADTIRATADHVAAAVLLTPGRADHRARQWLLDLDLTPLGEEPDVFDANMVDLAAEMPSGEPSERYEKLIEALRHFAATRPLYRSMPLRTAFEPPAQANMMRYLSPASEPVLAR